MTRLFVLLAVLLLGSPALTAAGAVDPFYQDLFNQGRAELERGNDQEAVRTLRLACFGMLDHPDNLSTCLTHLAVAHARTDDREAFEAIFQRLTTLAGRFDAYPGTDLPAVIREEMESKARSWIPEEQLLRSDTFRPLGREVAARRISGLSGSARLQALETRAAADPDHLPWRAALAQALAEEGRDEAAAEQAAWVLEREPYHSVGRCVRGAARARGGDCAGAVDDLALCERSIADQALALLHLSCLIEEERWPAAHELSQALEPEIASRRPVRRLIRQVDQGLEERASARRREAEGHLEEATRAPVEIAEEAEEVVSAEPETPRRFTADEVATLEEARETLRGGPSLSAVRTALDRVRPIAEVHRDDPETQFLAAQLAYRASLWEEASRYFRRGGDPGDDQPALLFYKAVALYETDDREGAAELLERALPRLNRTPYVDLYVDRILRP